MNAIVSRLLPVLAFLGLFWSMEALAAQRALLTPLFASTLAQAGLTDAALARKLDALQMQASRKGRVRLIVGVRAAFAPEADLPAGELVRQRAEIADAQSRVLQRLAAARRARGLPDSGGIGEIGSRFETIPFFVYEATPDELPLLLRDGDVLSLDEDRLARATLAESSPLIGATKASGNGFTGSGQVVAILDTGVEKTHPFLDGKVISEACYSTNSAADNALSVCPGGVTTSTDSGSGGSCGTDCDHGTHVAGIVAGASASFSGVAPGAKLVAVQVFSRFNSSEICDGEASCVLSYTSDQIKGLERVYALRNSYSIASVNMSLGGDRYGDQASCDAENAALKAVVDNLRAARIPAVISSGNDGYSDSMGAPGCISSAISVGSTWDASGVAVGFSGCNETVSSVDKVACYSNSVSFLKLLAPGSAINSSIPGGAYAVYHGTSMAAPQVAGAWAVLRQVSPLLSVDSALDTLTATGVAVYDARNGLVRPRIDLEAALISLGVGYSKIANNGTLLSDSATLGSGASDWGCTRDNATGLMWEIKTADGGLRDMNSTYTNYDNLFGSEAQINAASNSIAFVNAVNSTGLCGHNDWRMPTQEEISVLRNFSYRPTIDPNYFPNTAQSYFWSSTSRSTKIDYAWAVGFNGQSVMDAPRSYSYPVRLVRAAQSPSTHALSTYLAGEGSGSITSSAGGVSCHRSAGLTSGICAAELSSGAEVVLTATPAAGSAFGGWRGGCSGADPVCTLSMRAARSVTATFDIPVSQHITFGTAPDLRVGSSATLTASASSGLPIRFSSLTDSICTVSGDRVQGVAVGSCTVAADQDGNSSFLPAPQVTQTFAVNAAASSHTLSVTSVGAGSVPISASPAPYGGTTNYSQTGIAAGTLMTLTAPATQGSASFSAWTGCDARWKTDCTLTVNTSRSVEVSYVSPPAGNLLVNPGFESGAASGWRQFTSSGQPLIFEHAYAHAGIYMAGLGVRGTASANSPLVEYLEQGVEISGNARRATLEFWYAINTQEASGADVRDTLEFALYAGNGNKLLTLASLSNLDVTSDQWAKKSHTFDISPYRGQTVYLRITAVNDTGNSTLFSVDDLSLVASGASGRGTTPSLMLLLE